MIGGVQGRIDQGNVNRVLTVLNRTVGVVSSMAQAADVSNAAIILQRASALKKLSKLVIPKYISGDLSEEIVCFL